MDPAYVIIRIHAEPDPREENAKKKLCIGINLDVRVFQPKLRFLTYLVSFRPMLWPFCSDSGYSASQDADFSLISVALHFYVKNVKTFTCF